MSEPNRADFVAPAGRTVRRHLLNSGLKGSTLAQQNWWLSATAWSAGIYGLLIWIVGTYVFSAWPLDRSQDLAPIIGLATTFSVINALWGVALIVDLLNASVAVGRSRMVWIVGTVMAMMLVALGQLAVANMRLAAGG